MSQDKARAEVWETIQALNRLWTIENRTEEIAQFFHEHMVAISPTDRLRLEGREACVAAWCQFTQAARIHYWKEIDPKIDLFGNNTFAIVTYYYDSSVEMGGQTLALSGRDMYALVKEDGKWLVVADQFSGFPK